MTFINGSQKLKQMILSLDQWCLNHIWSPQRIFLVPLNRCIDEFGNLYGHDNSHFLTKAVALLVDENSVKNHLRYAYQNHRLKSVNQMLGMNIGHPYGDMYFQPWEEARVRPLEKFLLSHKIGPTPEDALSPIIERLKEVFHSIKMYGFRPYSKLNAYPRVIPISNGVKTLYMLRDGNHRAAVLSHLQYDSIPVIHCEDFNVPSALIRCLKGGGAASKKNKPSRRVVSPVFSEDWPHVVSGVITKELAERLFFEKYNRSFRLIEE